MSEKYRIARHFWEHKDDGNYVATASVVASIFSIDLREAQVILSKLRKDRILDSRAAAKGREVIYFLRGGVDDLDINALESYTVEQLLKKEPAGRITPA